MKNIFISKPDSKNPKFINFLSITNNTIINYDNIKIYEYFYRGIKTFIIHENNMDNIVITFLNENIDKIKMIIYLETEPSTIIDHPNVIYVSRMNQPNNSKNIINISNFTLMTLFNTTTKKSNQKNEQNIACFIDHIQEITTELTQCIESIIKQSKYHLRLFNNSQIHHPHNVGLLSEKDKAHVLKTHGYFLNNNSEYIDEARLCGCKIIDQSDPQNINNIETQSIDNLSMQFTDISVFNENFCI